MEEQHKKQLTEEQAALVLRTIEKKASTCGVIYITTPLFVLCLGIFLSLTVMGEEFGIPMGRFSTGEAELHGRLFFYELVVAMGCVNIVLAVRRILFSHQILVMQPASLIERMKPAKGAVISLLFNLIFGCLAGAAAPISWLLLRRYVLKNKGLLLAFGLQTRSVFTAMNTPEYSDKWICKNCAKTNPTSLLYCTDCSKYRS